MTGPLVLGIESSCDETAVALVRGDRTILAQRIASSRDTSPVAGNVAGAARNTGDGEAPVS